MITPKFAASFDKQARRPPSSWSPRPGVCREAKVFATGVSTIDGDSATALVAGSFTDSYKKGGAAASPIAVPHRGQPGQGRRQVARRRLHPGDGSQPVTSGQRPAGTTCSASPRTPPRPRSARPGRRAIADLDPTDRTLPASTTRPPRCCSTRSAGRRTTPSCAPPSSSAAEQREAGCAGRPSPRRPCREAPPPSATGADAPRGRVHRPGLAARRGRGAGRARRRRRRLGVTTVPSDASVAQSTRDAQAPPSARSARSCPTTTAPRPGPAGGGLLPDRRLPHEVRQALRGHQAERPAARTVVTSAGRRLRHVRSGDDRVDVLLSSTSRRRTSRPASPRSTRTRSRRGCSGSAATGSSTACSPARNGRCG